MPETADLFQEIVTLKAMLIASEARNLRKDERIEPLVAAFRVHRSPRRREDTQWLRTTCIVSTIAGNLGAPPPDLNRLLKKSVVWNGFLWQRLSAFSLGPCDAEGVRA